MVTTSVGMLNRLKQQQGIRTEQDSTELELNWSRTGVGHEQEQNRPQQQVLKQTQGNNHH